MKRPGRIVQVTENGFMGMLCVSNIAMKLFIMSGGGGCGRGRGPEGAAWSGAGGRSRPWSGTRGRAAGRGRTGCRAAGKAGVRAAEARADQADSRDRPSQTFRRRGCQDRETGGELHARLRNHPSHASTRWQHGPRCNDDFMYFRVGGRKPRSSPRGRHSCRDLVRVSVRPPAVCAA